MKPLDPAGCPTQIKVLNAICEIHDETGIGVQTGQVSARLGMPRVQLGVLMRTLEKKGFVRIEDGGYRKPEFTGWMKVKTAGRRPNKIYPLFRSNGEPYKRDMIIAAQAAEFRSNNPLKPAICPPGYARGYRECNKGLTVRPTGKHLPSTEGLW